MKHIDRVLAQDSRRPLFHALKGLALSHLNDGDGAMKCFERAGEPAKNLDGPQRWRGEALARLHQDDDAIAQLEQVTTRWPEDLAAQQLLLGLLEEKK
jgi:tetratricopeptide (TPR) repeat protein